MPFPACLPPILLFILPLCTLWSFAHAAQYSSSFPAVRIRRHALVRPPARAVPHNAGLPVCQLAGAMSPQRWPIVDSVSAFSLTRGVPRRLSREHGIRRLSRGPSGAVYGFALVNASFGSAVVYDEGMPTRASVILMYKGTG
ncbi:hypothetical protein BD310DRAFT_821304 [Dichomitus squalens]|uniref:Secreted protein n=1 Tax=Dichomitus squalens TaxID=114155 RepID=A0A4Q9PSZ8_9APHY|nr:hypothetical protein BD310DRAFT_821304 [Dichomitus squalens]